MTEVGPDVERVVVARVPEPVLALGAFALRSPLRGGGIAGALATLASVILRRRRLRLAGTGYLAVTQTQVYLCDLRFAPTRVHHVAQKWRRDQLRAMSPAKRPFEVDISIGDETVELVAINYDAAAQEVIRLLTRPDAPTSA
jgi:hypothetical protein